MAVKKVRTDVLGQVKTELAQLNSKDELDSVGHERRWHLQAIVSDADLWRLSEVEPVITRQFAKFVGEYNWLYQNCFYEVTGAFTDEEKKLLIMGYCDKERQKFERLKAKFNSEASQEIRHERLQIPEEVRIAVWRRDQGKCARCGSRENLEYDHIVPVSKGGSNTVRNVELLCESCNRQKGDRIQ
jgi:hypothetical protein